MDTVVTVGASTAGTTATTAGKRGLSSIEPGDFMKILIKQLQYQDPFEPVDNEKMLAQISEIRNMELSATLTESLKSLTEQQRFGSAAALIGKRVTGVVTGSDGQETKITGIVTAVRFTSTGEPVLELEDGVSFPLKNLVEVTDPAYVRPNGADGDEAGGTRQE